MNVNNPYLQQVRGTRQEITCSMIAEARRLEADARYNEFMEWCQKRGVTPENPCYNPNNPQSIGTAVVFSDSAALDGRPRDLL